MAASRESTSFSASKEETMSSNLSRRSFLAACPAAALMPGIVATVSPPPPVSSSFPTQEPDLVREIVGVSHRDLSRVKALVERHPTLAKAAWDWGFGDWESALGAASHVGNREIAEHLIAHGAQPTIFSAAMLGQLEVVKAFLASAPGIERTKGPHGITLLEHARAGGPPAAPVLRYLGSVDGSDEPLAVRPLEAEHATKLAGSYGFGPDEADRIDVQWAKDYLTFERIGRSPIRLRHRGDLAFSSAGSDGVRIRFTESPAGWILTVHDPDLVLTARKPAG
jgi:hypothetical protein